MSNKISGKSHSHSSYHAATPSRNTAKSSPSKNSSSSSKNSTSTSSKATTRPAPKTVTKPATKPVTKTTTKSNTSTSSSKKTDKKISSNEVKKNSTDSSKKDVKSKEKNIAKNFISLNSKQSAKPKKPHKPVPTSNQKIETGLPFPTIPIAQYDFYIKAIKEWYKTHAEAPANGNYTGFTSENLNSYDSFIPINNPIQKESPNQLNSSPVNFHPINPGMTKPNLSNNTSSKKNEPSKNIIISSKDVVVLKTNTGNKTPVSKKQEKKKVFFNSKKEEVQWTPKKEKGNKSVLTTKATIKQVISKTMLKTSTLLSPSFLLKRISKQIP